MEIEMKYRPMIAIGTAVVKIGAPANDRRAPALTRRARFTIKMAI